MGDVLPNGTTLLAGQYSLESFVYQGGFGMTYIATDRLGRTSLIKECFPEALCVREGTNVVARKKDQETNLKRVIELANREARQIASLDHPNIVAVKQVFEENNTSYMALEFVEGEDLLSLRQRGRQFSSKLIEQITNKMLSALDHLHSKNIIHRDVSPDNIMLGADNKPVLIDFGSAKEMKSEGERRVSSLLAVKPGYSPIEFYKAGRGAGPASDLYSLAASIYHLISGTAPIDAQSRAKATSESGIDPYMPLAGCVDGYSQRFLKEIDRALSLKISDRPQSAKEWLQKINGSVVATIGNDPLRDDQQPKPAKGLKTLLMMSAAAVAIVGGGGVFLMSKGSTTGTVEVAAANPVKVAPAEVTPVEVAEKPAETTFDPESIQLVASRVQSSSKVAVTPVKAEGPSPVVQASFSSFPSAIGDDINSPQIQPQSVAVWANKQEIAALPELATENYPDINVASVEAVQIPNFGHLVSAVMHETTENEATLSHPVALTSPAFASAAPEWRSQSLDPLPSIMTAPAIESIMASDLQTQTGIYLPFNARIAFNDAGNPMLVVQEMIDTSNHPDNAWMTAGTRISLIEGQSIQSLTGLIEQKTAALQNGDAIGLSVNVFAAGPNEDRFEMRQFTLITQTELHLENGLVISEIQNADNSTVLKINSASENGPAALNAGDVLILDAATGQEMTNFEQLARAISDANQEDRSALQLMALRDGRQVLASLTVPAGF